MKRKSLSPFPIIGLLLFVIVLAGNAIVAAAAADEVNLKIPCLPITVTRDGEGYALFSGKNLQFLNDTGKPSIPLQVVKILLPPDADLSTATASLEQVRFEEIPGEWEVRPVPLMGQQERNRSRVLWPSGKTLVDGRDVRIYGRNAPFPDQLIQSIHKGKMRKWNLVDVAVFCIQYNPVTQRLYRLAQAELKVEFSRDIASLSEQEIEVLQKDRMGEDKARKPTRPRRRWSFMMRTISWSPWTRATVFSGSGSAGEPRCDACRGSLRPAQRKGGLQ